MSIIGWEEVIEKRWTGGGGVKGIKKLSKNSKKYMILDRSKVLLISSELTLKFSEYSE